MHMVVWLFENGMGSFKANMEGDTPLSVAPVARPGQRHSGGDSMSTHAESLTATGHKIKQYLNVIAEHLRTARKTVDAGNIKRLRFLLSGRPELAITRYTDNRTLIEYARAVDTTPMVRDHLRHLPTDRLIRLETLSAMEQRQFTELAKMVSRGDIRSVRSFFTPPPRETPLDVARYHARVADDSNRRTLMHRAALAGSVQLMEFLYTIAFGDVALTDRAQNSMLSMAAQNGHTEVCEWLRVNHLLPASPHATNSQSRTPFAQAAAGCHLETLKWFVEHDLASDEPAAGGQTPLLFACAGGSVECVRYLHATGHSTSEANQRGETPMHVAVNSRNAELVRLLSSAGLANTDPDALGMTPFAMAVRQGSVEVARMLCEVGATSIVPDNNGDTPTHYAVTQSREDMLELLWDNGLLTFTPNKEGSNPLVHGETISGFEKSDAGTFLRRVYMEIERVLGHMNLGRMPAGASRRAADSSLESRVDKKFRLMKSQAIMERVSAIITTAEHGLDNSHQHAPLMAAARAGNQAAVEGLLQFGVSPDLQSVTTGRSALHYAVAKGHMAVVRLLLEAGASPTLADAKGSTPLECAPRSVAADAAAIFSALSATATLRSACRSDNTEVGLEALMENADPGPLGCTKRTALHWAAAAGAVALAGMLLNRPGGRDLIALPDSAGNTALHLAASHRHEAVALLLLESGAPIDARNFVRQTPTDCARAANCKALGIELQSRCLVMSVRQTLADSEDPSTATVDLARLMDAGGTPGALDADGNSALHHAARAHNYPLCLSLVAIGVPPTGTNVAGETPADLAADSERLQSYLRSLPAQPTPTLLRMRLDECMHDLAEAAAALPVPRLVALCGVLSRLRPLPMSLPGDPKDPPSAVLDQQEDAIEEWARRQLTLIKEMQELALTKLSVFERFASTLAAAAEASRGLLGPAAASRNSLELDILNDDNNDNNNEPTTSEHAANLSALEPAPAGHVGLLVQAGLRLLSRPTAAADLAEDLAAVTTLSACGLVFDTDTPDFRAALLRLAARSRAALLVASVDIDDVAGRVETAMVCLDASDASVIAGDMADSIRIGLECAPVFAFGSLRRPAFGRLGPKLSFFSKLAPLPAFEEYEAEGAPLLWAAKHKTGGRGLLLLRAPPLATMEGKQLTRMLRAGIGASIEGVGRIMDVMGGKCPRSGLRGYWLAVSTPPDVRPAAAQRLESLVDTADRVAAASCLVRALAHLSAREQPHGAVDPDHVLVWTKPGNVRAMLLPPIPTRSPSERLRASAPAFAPPEAATAAVSWATDLYSLCACMLAAWPELCDAQEDMGASLLASALALGAATDPTKRPSPAEMLVHLAAAADTASADLWVPPLTWRGDSLPLARLPECDPEFSAFQKIIADIDPNTEVTMVARIENAHAARTFARSLLELADATPCADGSSNGMEVSDMESSLRVGTVAGTRTVLGYVALPGGISAASAAVTAVTHSHRPLAGLCERPAAPFGPGAYASASPRGLLKQSPVPQPLLVVRVALGSDAIELEEGSPLLHPRIGGGLTLSVPNVSGLVAAAALSGTGVPTYVVPMQQMMPEWIVWTHTV